MNIHALNVFRTLNKEAEEIIEYKSYLESIYELLDDRNCVDISEDFYSITKTILNMFIQYGFTDIQAFIDTYIHIDDVSKEGVKKVIENIYPLICEFVIDYQKNIRCCISCNEKVYYLSVPNEFNELKKKYNLLGSLPETLNEKEYICPVCNALDRERLIIAYIEHLKLEISRDTRIIQFAPSLSIERYLIDRFTKGHYESADLYMDGVTYKLDIQDMNALKDSSYDLWICSHVLEHVHNDRKALKELYRITKKSGIGILLVPIDLNCKQTDEEIGCSEEENWIRFGQGDHVRKYAKSDFIDRIIKSGFTLELVDKSYFDEKLFKDNGLTETSTLYIVKK